MEDAGEAPNEDATEAQGFTEGQGPQPEAPPVTVGAVEDRVALLERKLADLENQVDQLRKGVMKSVRFMMQQQGRPIISLKTPVVPAGRTARYQPDFIHPDNVVEPVPEGAISRRYTLSSGRSDALARFLKEQGLGEIKLRVEGNELEILATPEVHAALAPFLALLGK
jgi:hypothetical protein